MCYIVDSDSKYQDIDSKKQYYITFKKGNFNWTFSVALQQTFKALFEILKKLCVLSNFSSDFKILELLGKGHFATVYSVENVWNQKIFAAKFLEKRSDKFKNHSVCLKKN